MEEATFISYEHLVSKLQKCDDCCNGDYLSFHCPLCPVSKYKPRKKAKLQSHLLVHWDTRIKGNNDHFAVVCHHPHGEITTRHFHCPCCGKIIKKKENMIAHAKKCNGGSNNEKHDEQDPNRTNEQRNILEEHCYESSSPQLESEPVKRQNKKEKCSKCGKMISIKWMPQHVRNHNKTDDIHKNRHHHTILIDQNAGIYCSAINLSGPSVPIHVIKKTTGSCQENLCELQQCSDAKQVAKRGGNLAYECAHLRSVQYAIRGKNINLQEHALGQLKDKHFFTEERFNEICTYRDNALSTGSPLLVEIPPKEHASTRFVYLSIFAGLIRHWSKVGRTLVTFDSHKNTVSCKCSNSKRYCIHKAIAKWYIFQEKPQYFSSLDDNSDDGNVSDTNQPDISETFEAHRKTRIGEMLLYFQSEKKIPASIPKDITHIYNSDEFINEKKIYPRETSCHSCNGSLTLEQTSVRSKIILMNSVYKEGITTTGIEVYVKVCPRCRIVYRYQEWNEGIHNYNNTVFLGIDVCRFLRAGLINHVALGRSVAVLEEMLSEKLNIMEIENAYLHFESMSDHSYNYNCVLCGHFPSIIIWDTFRKATFRFADLEKHSDAYNDTVNMKDFWGKIEDDILLRSLSNESTTQNALTPDFSFWSPWIGPNSRKSDVVYNTEYKKCCIGNADDINEPMPEELLMHLLLDEKVTSIRRLCREVGVKGDGSSMDMILRLRETSITKSSFDRAYEKVFGCTGGWAVGCCRHGIVYAIKNLLRSESPRDYIDLERSLKHRPTITISDIAHLMAKHGNKTVPGFFHPDEGRLDVVTPDTLENVATGSVKYSMPFLTDPILGNYSDNTNYNPTTGINDHYSLYDWFHQDNCRKKEETLRKCSLVKEISGFLDTQAVEQLFSCSKKDIYFLNNMTARNHLFFFRLIYHLRNEKINTRLLIKHEKLLGSPLNFNDYGQMYQNYLQCEENEVIYEAVPVIQELSENELDNTKEIEENSGKISEEHLENTMEESHTNKIKNSDIELLEDLIAVVTEQLNSLSNDEISNFQRNVRYIKTVLFQHPGRERREQVKIVPTAYGLFQCQGSSNYCGLCCINNALGIDDVQLAITVDEMDEIADKIWIGMVNNPSHGLTVDLEPMRDREGYYSVEVLHWALKLKGYEMLKLNSAAITSLTPEETGINLARQLLSAFSMMIFIIRPKTSQHWISIRYFEDSIFYLDSRAGAPRIITSEELGEYVIKHSEDPGAVYFLSLSGFNEETQDVHTTNETKSMDDDVTFQTEKKTYDLRANPPKKRKSNHIYNIPKKVTRIGRSKPNNKDDYDQEDDKDLPDIVQEIADDDPVRNKTREEKEKAKAEYIMERNKRRREELEKAKQELNPHQYHRMHNDACDIYNYLNHVVTSNKLKPASEGLFWSNRLSQKKRPAIGTTICDYLTEYVECIVLDDDYDQYNDHSSQMLFSTLVHEFTHAYLIVHNLGDYSDHGQVWNRNMKQIVKKVNQTMHLRPACIKGTVLKQNLVFTHLGERGRKK